MKFLILPLLFLSLNAKANIPDGDRFNCNGTLVSFQSKGEVFPTPYEVVVNSEVFNGHLSAQNLNTINFDSAGSISVYKTSEGRYDMFLSTDDRDIAQVLSDCLVLE